MNIQELSLRMVAMDVAGQDGNPLLIETGRDESLTSISVMLDIVLNGSSELVMLLDTDLRIVWANQTARDKAPARNGSLIGRQCHTLWFNQNGPCPDCPALGTFSTRTELRSELKARDGCHYVVRSHPLKDTSGNVKGAVVFYEDITRRKLAEASACRAEKQYRHLFNNAVEGMFQTTPEGVLIDANIAAATILGYANPAELILTMNDLAARLYLDPQQRGRLMALLRERHVVNGFEVQFRCKDERVIWVELNLRAVFDHRGNFIRTEGFFHDITERKHTEEALRSSELRFRQIVEFAPLPMAIVAADGRMELLNRQCIKTFGYELTDVPTLEIWRQKTSPNEERLQEDFLFWCSALEEIDPPGTGVPPLEQSLICKDGTVREVEYRFVRAGEQLVLALTDLTPRKRLEDIAIQVAKMQALDSIVACTAHGINNPLSVILASVQSISRRLSPQHPTNMAVAARCGIDLEQLQTYLTQREISPALDWIRSAAGQAASVVVSMLDFRRGYGSIKTLHFVSEILDRVLNYASKGHEMELACSINQLTVEREDMALPRIAVCRPEIELVLLTLIRNAVQAMSGRANDPERPLLTLRTYSEGDWQCVAVQDNGPGMDALTREKVFEPLICVRSGTPIKGIGLYIARRLIVQNHGGQLDVTSQPGQGSRFTVRLPFPGATGREPKEPVTRNQDT